MIGTIEDRNVAATEPDGKPRKTLSLAGEELRLFHELLPITGPEASRFVSRLRDRQRADVDEAAQVATLALIEAIRSYQPKYGKLDGFARQVIRRRLGSSLASGFVVPKARDARTVSLSMELPGMEGDPLSLIDTIADEGSPDPLEKSLSADVLERLMLATSVLSHRGRQLISLRFRDGKLFREIGAELAVSEVTSCKHLNGALVTLRALMSDDTPAGAALREYRGKVPPSLAAAMAPGMRPDDRLIVRAVESLGVRDRLMIILGYGSGLSWPEVFGLMGITKGDGCKRLSSARNQIRDYLRASGGGRKPATCAMRVIAKEGACLPRPQPPRAPEGMAIVRRAMGAGAPWNAKHIACVELRKIGWTRRQTAKALGLTIGSVRQRVHLARKAGAFD